MNETLTVKRRRWMALPNAYHSPGCSIFSSVTVAIGGRSYVWAVDPFTIMSEWQYLSEGLLRNATTSESSSTYPLPAKV